MKLLVVEDEQKLAQYLQKGLGTAGFVVDLAHDGVTGLHMSLEFDYSVIILDSMLPGMDGLALLAALRAHPLGADAARIGVVTADPHHFVQMDTRFGGRRVVDWLSGEQLPRIC